MLDGSPLPTNAFIRDFQQGKAGYVADAVEQALLFPKDMADLRSLRRHGVFLSLKRDLTMVSLLINPFFCKFPPLCSLYYFPFFTFTMFLSSAGYSSPVPSRGDNKFLPLADEGRRREMNSGRRRLPRGRKK